MSNSLNFLNKPTPAKTYGPTAKPSTAAPKPFIDKANPWAVGGSAPTAPAKPQPPAPRAPVQASPRATPQPRQAPQYAPAAPPPAIQPPQPVAPPTPAPWQMAPAAQQAMTMRPAPPAPQPAPVAPPPQPQPDDRFYGYAPPGPILAQAPPGQRFERPQYTQIGQRMLMPEASLAVEDAKRQRDAAGSFGALQMSGKYRPWNSYSPAEKYYLRYGMMPQGAENTQVQSAQPAAATARMTEQDANAAAREIAKRYMPDKDVSTLNLAEIGAILTMSYTPPAGLEQKFGRDMDWLSDLIQTE